MDLDKETTLKFELSWLEFLGKNSSKFRREGEGKYSQHPRGTKKL